MIKITEDYVSFETAKLLKEKGFSPLGYYFEIFDLTNRDTTGCNKPLCIPNIKHLRRGS